MHIFFVLFLFVSSNDNNKTELSAGITEEKTSCNEKSNEFMAVYCHLVACFDTTSRSPVVRVLKNILYINIKIPNLEG